MKRVKKLSARGKLWQGKGYLDLFEANPPRAGSIEAQRRAMGPMSWRLPDGRVLQSMRII